MSKVIEIQPAGESLLIDLKGAAKLLGLSIWTVRDLVWGNQIPHRKIGRRVWLRTADVRNYVDNQAA